MSTPNISISTELMKNYKQAEIMSPEKKFEALQTGAGCSLLFSIGTDNIFYVTEETAGHNTGWTKTDLSSAQIAKSFPGQTGLACKTFEAAQSVADGTIGMAMVVSDAAGDHLFLCLGNSDSDTSWTKEPAWIQYPFDNPAKSVVIVNVFLSETIENTQFIVVDILRDPASAEKLISRYYLNTQNPNEPAWQPHDVSVDLEADGYSSCLGRQHLQGPHQPAIDGLYTFGQVDGNAQFTFQPLYNVFNPSIPAQAYRLQLPGNLIAESMASCRKSDMSTDLYVCSGGGLYYFASGNQNDGSTAVLLAQNEVFEGVRKMYAHQINDTVTVWGLNGNDEIFYTTCAAGQETAAPSAWSYPLPIVTGADLFSPYINRVDSGNTFFFAAENTLQKLIKSTENSIWQSQSVTLPSTNIRDTQKYSSYTTRIQATDENNQPLANSTISISSDTRTVVYINHLYYVIDSTGVAIETDELGSITIVEWVNSLTGTKLNVSDAAGNSTKVNPMDAPFNKIAQLNSADSLKKAAVTTFDSKTGSDTTAPLVSSDVSPQDLQTVASANGQLSAAYQKLSSSGQTPLAQRPVTAMPMTASVGGFHGIWVDIGDLFHWLKSGVEAVIHIVEDAARGAWHFVAEIAGKVYAAVLDAAEKVVGAVEWVFDKIKTGIEDLIKYAEFLFKWSDILITHRVLKNVFLQFTRHSIDNLNNYKKDISLAFSAAISDVNKWANIPAISQTYNSTTSGNKAPAGQNSAPAQLGVHHFQGNAAKSTTPYTPAPVDESNFDDLINALKKHEDNLNGACDGVKNNLTGTSQSLGAAGNTVNFHSLTVTEIIERIAAVLADKLLKAAEDILLAALDVFIKLAEGLIDLLTKPIEIPVISWLYKEIADEDLTVLDLVCLISAIPITIIYKIATTITAAGAAPFPKGDSFTDGLLNATSFQQIQSLFFTSTAPEAARNIAGGMMMTADNAPVLDEARLKVFGFTTGIAASIGSVLLIITSVIQKDYELKGVSPTEYKSVTISSGIANILYVSPNIATFINAKTDVWYEQLNNALTGVSLIKGFVNVPISTSPGLTNASAGIESIINLAWNVPVIYNIKNNHDCWNTTYKSLVPESVGNFAFNIGGILEYPIAKAVDLDTKAGELALQISSMLIYGICMPIAGGIYCFEKEQTHL